MDVLESSYTIDQLCEMLGVSRGTLQNWRSSNKGPRWVKLGRKIYYPKADLDQWVLVNYA